MIDAAKILLPATTGRAIPLQVIAAETWAKAKSALPKAQQRWADAQGFSAGPLSFVLLPGPEGALERVLVGAPKADDDPFALGSLASKLPDGIYRFAEAPANAGLVALGWCLELYKFDPHRQSKIRAVRLVCPAKVRRDEILRQANAGFAVRDWVNTPANLMGPEALERVARDVAKRFAAKLKVIKGKELARGFPLIQAVGAAGPQPPRLVDFTWGPEKAPKVTLIGKGVVFDTGGLDIKPPASMLLMKKDMGGAANVLGLSSLIMAEKLKLRLRVLIPIVENSISAPAFRPGDVFKSRKGLTVEIGNTDAEGRLILADAIALADEEAPELLIDMATLTGAARVALGPDLPPFYTDDDSWAALLAKHAARENDPLWRMPLWRPYTQLIETPIADLNNSGSGGQAGSITAALFLRRFTEKAKAHVHFDIFAWTPNAKPGRPKGGEHQGIRAIFAALKERFG